MAIVSKVVRADAETTGTSLAKLRAKEGEPFVDMNSAVGIATDGEIEGPRLVGARNAAWHRRNRVGLAIGNVDS
jgi:hypothetical protein